MEDKNPLRKPAKSANEGFEFTGSGEVEPRHAKRETRATKGEHPSFYRRQYVPAEQRDLAGPGRPGVQDEIELLRVAMRRTLELASGLEDLAEMRLALNALSTAAARLADLMRAQEKAASSKDGALAALLERAITESWDEMVLERAQERRG